MRELDVITIDELIKFIKIFNHEYSGKEWSVYNFNDALTNWIKPKEELMPPIDSINFMLMRKFKRYTLRYVQEKTGISNAYLSQLENGKIKKPSYDTVRKLFMFYRTEKNQIETMNDTCRFEKGCGLCLIGRIKKQNCGDYETIIN